MNKLLKKSRPGSSPARSRAQSTDSPTNLVTPSANALLRGFEEPEGNQVSNTMKMALAGTHVAQFNTPASVSSSIPDVSASAVSFVRFPPRSPSEQYWAVRALTAETLLTTKQKHHREVQSVTLVQESKRATDVAQIAKIYDDRLMKMERLLAILMGILFLFTLFMLISHISLAHKPSRAGRGSQWAHFTIPILSPFASVVEHEVSVIGSRTITSVCLIIAGLAYFLFRYWISRSKTRSS
ncbi:hypothetical protein BDP27DRAFT_1309500 [Rhodocollybia butyracea]|uniref:Uncharacterized protein n=1 Tax=Rhodocollybia butyracea TaxID=206335 RepID=A0A9P5UGF8_9AGAR|nr:hypothetical protein BDP27DRAFT_1309500 [Rhodocollybia butyracea]